MTSSFVVRQLAQQYRSHRLSYDRAAAAFDADERDEVDEALEQVLHAAFDRCQASARLMARIIPSEREEWLDRCAILLDAGLLADLPAPTLIAMIVEGTA